MPRSISSGNLGAYPAKHTNAVAVKANNRPTYCLIQYIAFISFPCSSIFGALAAALLKVEAAAAVVAFLVGAMARVRVDMGATRTVQVLRVGAECPYVIFAFHPGLCMVRTPEHGNGRESLLFFLPNVRP